MNTLSGDLLLLSIKHLSYVEETLLNLNQQDYSKGVKLKSWKAFLHLLHRKYDKYDDMFVKEHIEFTVYEYVNKHDDDIGRVHIIDRCHNAGGVLDRIIYRNDTLGYARLQFGDKRKALELFLIDKNMKMLLKMKDYIRNQIDNLKSSASIILQIFNVEDQIKMASRWLSGDSEECKINFMGNCLMANKDDILTDMILWLILNYKLKVNCKRILFNCSIFTSNPRFVKSFYQLYKDELGDITSEILKQSNPIKVLCMCYNCQVLTSKQVVEIYSQCTKISDSISPDEYNLLMDIHLKEGADMNDYVQKSFNLFFYNVWTLWCCVDLLEKYDWLPLKPVVLSIDQWTWRHYDTVLTILNQRGMIDKHHVKNLSKFLNIEQYKIVLPILDENERITKARYTLATSILEAQRKDCCNEIVDFIQYLEHNNIKIDIQTIMEKILLNNLEDYLDYSAQMGDLTSLGLYIEVLRWLINTKRISNVRRMLNIAKTTNYVRLTHFLCKLVDPDGCYYI